MQEQEVMKIQDLRNIIEDAYYELLAEQGIISTTSQAMYEKACKMSEAQLKTLLNELETQEYTGTLGQKPLVYFNGLHIQENDLISLKIHSFNFAPTIEMSFSDSTGLLDDKSYP